MKNGLLLLLFTCTLVSSAFAQIVCRGISPAAIAGDYNFGWADPADGWSTPDFNVVGTYIQGTLVVANDGTAGTDANGNALSSQACSALINNVSGKIVVINRGTCEFGAKALNAQNAGAIGVIIVSNAPGVAPFAPGPGASGAGVTIPVVMISYEDGEALQAAMSSTVTMYIGNSVGYFAHDLAIDPEQAWTSPFGASPTQIDNGFQVACVVKNYGQNSENNVTLNAVINGPTGEIYNADWTLSTPLAPGDSVSPLFADFDLGGPGNYPVGTYTLTYSINLPTDNSMSNNSYSVSFKVQGSTISRATVDVNNKPTASSYNRSANATSEFSTCMSFQDENAGAIDIEGMYFMATADAATFAGNEFIITAFQWNDADATTFDFLTEIETGSYIPSSESEEMTAIYANFDAPIELENDQRYLFCVTTYNTDLYFGFDETNKLYFTNLYSDLPFAPNSSDGTWYPNGFGAQFSAPSIGLKLAECASPVTPTFAALTSVCQGGTAPSLATTSNQGFTGTWNPSSFSTATAGTYTATFTPTAGQCATTSTISFTVTTPTTPNFSALTGVCVGETAPALNTTSTNGISGTWNPASFSTASAGTFTSTFTPNGSQCASTTTINFTVSEPTTPTFTPISAVCQGGTAPTLNTTSTNGINGTWNPATINTAAAGTVTSTFTPNGGQCAATTTVSVSINSPGTTPAFSPLNSICQGETAPALNTSSLNNVTGTWNPSSFSSASSGTFTATFTPDNGQCAISTTISLTVNANVMPTFTAPAAVCQGATAPALPASSNEGISGTWNPSAFSTATTGTSTSTFTPASGTCTSTTTLTLTVNAEVTPTFAPLTPICQGDAAPVLATSSTEGVSGTWNPSSFSSVVSGTFTATFTPTAGQCASTATTSLTVNSAPLAPVVLTNNPVCVSETIVLSTPAITGTYSWSGPAGFISTAANPTIPNAQLVNSGTYNLNITVNGCESPAGSANVTVTDCENSIEEQSAIAVRVYPNPSAGVFAVEAGEQVTSIDVTDISGKRVNAVITEQNKAFTLDLSTQANGTYLVRVFTQNGTGLARVEVMH